MYLAGIVMLIFAVGLYGLFISNAPDSIAPEDDRAIKGFSLFGRFALRVNSFLALFTLHYSMLLYYSV